jgi:hypothetical protein
MSDSLEEVVMNIMMSLDFMESEIQNGGCKHALKYEGGDTYNW